MGFRYAHHPSRKMTLSMIDTLLIGTVPVHSPRVLAPPLFAPWAAVDAAQCAQGYRVGVSCRNGGVRSRCFSLQNQQQGELQGMCYTAHLVQKFGWGTTNVIGDNTAALASVRKLAANLRAVLQNKLLRRLFNLMWWSGTVLHLYWAPSELMPADALSRISQTTPVQVTDASVQAQEQWNTIMSDLWSLTFYGTTCV